MSVCNNLMQNTCTFIFSHVIQYVNILTEKDYREKKKIYTEFYILNSIYHSRTINQRQKEQKQTAKAEQPSVQFSPPVYIPQTQPQLRKYFLRERKMLKITYKEQNPRNLKC